MKITIKFDLDQNVHSTNELTEASKYLKLLSQHIEQNIDKKKLDRIIGANQPIHTKEKRNIGYYKFENKVIQKEETLEESLKDMNKTMCEWFGYTDQKGNYYYDGKLLLKANEDPEEWED